MNNHYQQKSKIWAGITIFGVILSLISGSVLLYQWWKTKQRELKVQELEKQLEQAKEKQAQAIQQYQKQQKQLPQVLNLAKNPTIHNFFNDLLLGYAYRFAQKQNLTAYCLSLTFGGFYQKTISDGENHREMGNCCLEKEQVIISLNQVFLFNKLGHERYLTSLELFLEIKDLKNASNSDDKSLFQEFLI